MKVIGSQIRETLEQAGSVLIATTPTGEAFVQDQNGGPIELWSQHDHHAGYTLEIGGIGHEFVREASAHDLLGAMTKNEFAAICGELLIDPALALENEKVQEALRQHKNSKEIKQLLETEF